MADRTAGAPRRSPLAVAQARWVADRLAEQSGRGTHQHGLEDVEQASRQHEAEQRRQQQRLGYVGRL